MSDIAQAVDFYSKLFGTEPAKVRPVQDSSWVDGPAGEPWEIYTVLADAEMPAGRLRDDVSPADALCCGDAAESAARCC